MWNKNERQGKVDQAKGRVEQAVGTLTRDDRLKAEGQVDEAVGKVEATVTSRRDERLWAAGSSGMTTSRRS